MKKTLYISLIHVGLQLLYTFLIVIDSVQSPDPAHQSLTFMLTLAFIMVIHFVLGILVIIIHSFAKRSDLIRAHLLGMGLALLIGGSVCFVAPDWII